jgi:hypothetical protein
VAEAERAIRAGLAPRMMLEISPDRSFGVLSPAFKGCESSLALEAFAHTGCTFLKSRACELHNTSYMPLECRFCHHTRPGQGAICHLAIESDWNTPTGQALVEEWNRLVGLAQWLSCIGR